MSSGPAEFVGFVGLRTRVWLALLVLLRLFWGLVAAPFAGEVARSLEFVSVYAVRLAWGRLLVGVERGRVVSAVADPGHSGLASCLTCAFREWEPDRFVRLGSRERPSVATGPLPSLVDARAGLLAVEGGASLESVTATWATPTERPVPANGRR